MSEGFQPDLFSFLRELRENNNRAWFEVNRGRFQEVVQKPMVDFIEKMGGWLRSHAPAFPADPRLNGGSLFRIYRDTRFSADKSPYKTNVGCNFRRRIGKDVHAPGFYVHMAPGEVFFGGGIWIPPTPVLNLIRDSMVARTGQWEEIVSEPSFAALLGGLAECDRLKSPPQGFPRDHPLAEDLRRKSIYAFGQCREEDVCSRDFPDRVMATFEAMLPLMQFLNDALQLQWDAPGELP